MMLKKISNVYCFPGIRTEEEFDSGDRMKTTYIDREAVLQGFLCLGHCCRGIRYTIR
jgi:hypothetical protein